MPAVITNNFRLLNARNFVDSFPASANSSVYLYIGRTHSWDKNPHTHAPTYSDQNVPSPDNSFKNNDYIIWDTLTSLVQLANTDVSFATKKVTWAGGRTYEKWNDTNSNLVNLTDGASDFFVINSSNEVFKCLDNNGGALSLSEPQPDPASVASLYYAADGYVWKYMYKIPSEYNTKFTMNNYMPVRTLTVAERAAMGSNDPWIVLKDIQDAAIPGTIDSVTLTAPGSGYPGSNGTIGTIASDGVDFTLPLLPSSPSLWDNNIDNRFANSTIIISNSTFETSTTVETSDASDGSITIDASANPNIITGSAHQYTYIMGPEAKIIGDGTAGLLYATVSVPSGVTTSEGPISAVGVANSGYGYTFADIEIVPVDNQQAPPVSQVSPPAGQGARATSILSPPGGHGSDPVRELSAYHVAIATELVNEGHNGTLIVGSQDYRQIGIIKDAKIFGGAHIANSAPGYDQTLRIVANSSSIGSSTLWVPALDEMLIGATSNAIGIVVDYDQPAITDSIIRLTGVRANSTGGSFEAEELLHPYSFETGKDEAKALRANTLGYLGVGASIISPDLDKYTGSIIYNENRSPISRTSDQKEDIKILVEF